MRVLKLLSILLDYPEPAVLDELRQSVSAAGGAGRLVEALDEQRLFSLEERRTIAAFVERLLAAEPTETQADYVQTFDLTPEHSLHLTHHIFGEEKTRGPALIDLTEYYKSHGFCPDERELPDFLPLILEFVSELDPDQARVFLGDTAKVLRVLAGNLEKGSSAYAPLVRIIENHGSLARLAA